MNCGAHNIFYEDPEACPGCDGIAEERDKVIKYLKQRVEDFQACAKDDCCSEHIYVIEGIISDIEDSEHYDR